MDYITLVDSHLFNHLLNNYDACFIKCDIDDYFIHTNCLEETKNTKRESCSNH